MHLTRRGFLLASGAAAIVPTHAAMADILQIEGPALGAGFRLRVAAGADVPALVAAVTDAIAGVDATMSPFRADSEVSAFNRAETRDLLPLSRPTLSVLAEARRIAELTRGAFDPTLGGLVGRLGFGPITRRPEGAFSGMTLTDDGARKAHPGQTLDLCGIAKGDALDRCMASLAALGHSDVFLELGGEVAATGLRPDGGAWRVAVEHPLAGPGVAHCVLRLRDEALATSGDRVNGYALGDRRIGHIVDPRLGGPARGPLASVSVLAPRAVTADALATALFALGAEQGPQLAQAARIDALFLARDGAGLRSVTTGRFADRIVEG